VFRFEFRHDPLIAAPTEIFVPHNPYPGGYRVEVSDGSYALRDDRRCLVYQHDPAQPVHRDALYPIAQLNGPSAFQQGLRDSQQIGDSNKTRTIS